MPDFDTRPSHVSRARVLVRDYPDRDQGSPGNVMGPVFGHENGSLKYIYIGRTCIYLC